MKKTIWIVSIFVVLGILAWGVNAGYNSYLVFVQEKESKRKLVEPISKQQAFEIASHRWSVEQVLANDPGAPCSGMNCDNYRSSSSEIVFFALPGNYELPYNRTIRIQRAGQPEFDKLQPGMVVEFNTTDNTCGDSNNLNVVCYLGIKNAEMVRNDIIGKWKLVEYEGGQ